MPYMVPGSNVQDLYVVHALSPFTIGENVSVLDSCRDQRAQMRQQRLHSYVLGNSILDTREYWL